MLLNIIIVSIVSFYLIFGIVYRGLLEETGPDLADESPWEQPYLIPKGLTLTQIDFPTGTQLRMSESGWILNEKQNEVAKLIADNWQELVVHDVSRYTELPKGQTALAFVAEQAEPIVFRLVIEGDMMSIYRMSDQRLFMLPTELKSVIWTD